MTEWTVTEWTESTETYEAKRSALLPWGGAEPRLIRLEDDLL